MKKSKLLVLIGIIMALVGIALVVLGTVFADDEPEKEADVPEDTSEVVESEDPESPFPEFLWKNKWYGAEGDIECDEKLTFTEDGEFMYSCACGSPVDDYDLYWEYIYDEESRIITLKGDEGYEEEMQVLFYDVDGLVIRLESGEVRTFRRGGPPNFEGEPEVALEYISDTTFAACVSEYKDGRIILIPSDYCTDERDRFEGMIFDFPVSPEAAVLSVTVTTNNGEVSLEKKELDWESAFITEDNTRPYILVALDEEGNITKAVMYGTMEIWG